MICLVVALLLTNIECSQPNNCEDCNEFEPRLYNRVNALIIMVNILNRFKMVSILLGHQRNVKSKRIPVINVIHNLMAAKIIKLVTVTKKMVTTLLKNIFTINGYMII